MVDLGDPTVVKVLAALAAVLAMALLEELLPALKGLLGWWGGAPGAGAEGAGAGTPWPGAGGAGDAGVEHRQAHRFSILHEWGAFVWLGAKGKVFRDVEAAQSAYAWYLWTPRMIRRALAVFPVLRCYWEFFWARRRDDGSSAARREMERYVARLLAATWTLFTGLPAFVVNDYAVADVVFCVNTKFEAYFGLQLKTCGGLREDGNLEFREVRRYTGLLVAACDRSTLEFLALSGKDLDLRGERDLKVRTLSF